MDFASWVAPVTQLVTTGGFGALVWYLLVRHIPNREAEHKLERREWLEYIKKRDENYEGLSIRFIESVEDLRRELELLKAQMGR